MTVYRFEGREPILGAGSYVHPSADVIGDVTIGAGCWIGPGARLRGDYGTIILGDGTSIEDNCVVHARPGGRTQIGNHVTVGHGCVIHNATIHDSAVIGMGSVVSDWAIVGEWAVVAEGAVALLARFAPMRRIVRESCNGCTLCVRACPMDAIEVQRDPAGGSRRALVGDPGECTVCIDCLTACRLGSNGFRFSRPLGE